MRGRPRNRWQDEVREDGRIFGGEGWQENLHNREECEEAPENGKESSRSAYANGMNDYSGCPRRKGPNFGRVFLTSNHTDITQNTYIQSSMVTEILAREKCGRRWCLRTVVSVTSS